MGHIAGQGLWSLICLGVSRGIDPLVCGVACDVFLHVLNGTHISLDVVGVAWGGYTVILVLYDKPSASYTRVA